MDKTRTGSEFSENSTDTSGKSVPRDILGRDLEFLLLRIDEKDPPVSHIGMEEKFLYRNIERANEDLFAGLQIGRETPLFLLLSRLTFI